MPCQSCSKFRSRPTPTRPSLTSRPSFVTPEWRTPTRASAASKKPGLPIADGPCIRRYFHTTAYSTPPNCAGADGLSCSSTTAYTPANRKASTLPSCSCATCSSATRCPDKWPSFVSRSIISTAASTATPSAEPIKTAQRPMASGAMPATTISTATSSKPIRATPAPSTPSSPAGVPTCSWTTTPATGPTINTP